MPDFVAPQLLNSAQTPPRGEDWRYELKYDGWRAQVHITANGVRIFTRAGLEWTDRFPQLAAEIARTVKVACILDGEICALDRSGRPNFTRLCRLIPAHGPLDFFAFDLLAGESGTTTHLPLFERRRRLTGFIPPTEGMLHLVDQSAEPAAALTFVEAHGWEGIVAKRASSIYRAGERTSDWLKLKLKRRQEFIIAGWRSDPRTGVLKSLVLATIDAGQLTLRGSVGTGFSQAQRRELPHQFRSTSRPPSPSLTPPFIPVEPELVAEIEYLELSDRGILRQPTFLGLRCDKSPEAVGMDDESFSPAIYAPAH